MLLILYIFCAISSPLKNASKEVEFTYENKQLIINKELDPEYLHILRKQIQANSIESGYGHISIIDKKSKHYVKISLENRENGEKITFKYKHNKSTESKNQKQEALKKVFKKC